MGFVGSAMQKVIPEIIKKSNAQFPNIHFTLDEMSNQAQIEALQHHKINLGFVRLDTAPKDIHLQPILEEHFALVLPKNYPINAANFKEIQQLKGVFYSFF